MSILLMQTDEFLKSTITSEVKRSNLDTQAVIDIPRMIITKNNQRVEKLPASLSKLGTMLMTQMVFAIGLEFLHDVEPEDCIWVQSKKDNHTVDFNDLSHVVVATTTQEDIFTGRHVRISTKFLLDENMVLIELENL